LVDFVLGEVLEVVAFFPRKAREMRGFLLLALAVTAAMALESKPSPDLVITSADRSLDMSTQLVKQSVKMVVQNGGKQPTKVVHFLVDPAHQSQVIHIEAKVGKTYLRTMKTSDGGYAIELKEALAGGSSVTIEVDSVMDGLLKMFPAQVTQKENQLVMFTGNHYLYSPYKVKTQTTKVALTTDKAPESYSKNLKPTSLSGNTITYGPYKDVAALSAEDLQVHYENNRPFLEITRLHRTLELSMWGNIAVEETVDVRHVGAKLKGSFSRLDFQRENSGVSAVKSFKTVLPASASGVYYRDDIGNISTSALRVLDDSVEVELRPRFPLFGGWKTHYLLGYNVPSYEYLYSERGSDRYVLNMRLLDHIFDDMIVDDFELTIILPEGCEAPKLATPYPVKRDSDGLHFTYLDTKGRPTITVRNVGRMTEKHIQDFQLEFRFSKISMLREPLLLVVAFFTFFALAMIYVRLDFALTKDEGSENKLRVAGYCEKVAGHQEKRVGHYQAFEGLLVSLKSTKDTGTFQAGSKSIATDHKNETAAISELGNLLKQLSPETAEKVAELQKQDRAFREHQVTQSGLVDKLVTGKLGKQQFIDQDGMICKKKDECVEKMESIMQQLRAV